MSQGPDLFPFDDDACRHLAKEHGTPMFAYREDVALAQVNRLREVLPRRVRLAYAVKANPHPQLLASFAGQHLSFDVASRGELDRLTRLDVTGDRIFFAGPGKRDHEIEAAIAIGARLQAEGLEDLERADALAKRLGLKSLAVNVRVQPRGADESAGGAAGILGGGGPNAFGVDEEDLPELLDAASLLTRVEIRGVHGFAASNERQAERLLHNHAQMMGIAQTLHDRGLEIEQIDLGGGLGVTYNESHKPLDLDCLGSGLNALLAENEWFRGELILEPGRFLAAACGTYLTRVTRTKTSRGEHFAILDGGINHLLRPLLTGEPFPVRRVGNDAQKATGDTELITLAGPLCTGLDRLGRVALPEIQTGDLLALGRVGAYGATEAMVRFLDHAPAPEIWSTRYPLLATDEAAPTNNNRLLGI